MPEVACLPRSLLLLRFYRCSLYALLADSTCCEFCLMRCHSPCSDSALRQLSPPLAASCHLWLPLAASHCPLRSPLPWPAAAERVQPGQRSSSSRHSAGPPGSTAAATTQALFQEPPLCRTANSKDKCHCQRREEAAAEGSTHQAAAERSVESRCAEQLVPGRVTTTLNS